jgi:pimeloyl-ACP methyl ester carboxylesterase
VRSTGNDAPAIDGLWGDRWWVRLLFLPSREPIPCAKERLEILVGDASVELWLEKNGPSICGGQPNLIVLRLLGARGRGELATLDPARFLPSVSSVVATVNPTGFGGTRGRCTLENYFAGVGAAYDAIETQFPDVAILVHGKSIGGLGALYLAAIRSPKAIVVRNVVDVSGIAAARFGSWVRRVVPKALDARCWAALARCPALFVVSSGDRLAKPAIQQAVIDTYGGPAARLEVIGAHDDRELEIHDVPKYVQALEQLRAR